MFSTRQRRRRLLLRRDAGCRWQGLGKRLFALGVSVSVCLQAVPGLAARPKVQLKIATVAPEGSTWMKVMRQIDAEVREATGNTVGFKIYPGGVQGDERVVLRKIRSGQLHGGGLTGLGLGILASACRVVELPFLLADTTDVDAAYAAVGDDLEAALQDAGYTLLGWAEVGFVYLFSRQPLATQDDLQSAKMWLWEGDPLAESLFRIVGVVPVPLAITDVMTSLQTGLVDAVYASPLGCLALQWFTRVQYYTDYPITFASGAVVVSNRAFDKVPATHRDTVLRICRQRFRELVQKTRRQNAEALVEIEKSGVQRVTVPGDELARFRELGVRVQEEQVGKLFPRELLQRVRAAIHP